MPDTAAHMSATHIPAYTLKPTQTVAVAPIESTPVASVPRFIDDVASGRVELPTIPRIVQRVIAALRDPDADARTVCDLLAQDPVLSAKVLRAANSSHFGAGRAIASIDAAVARIGTQALGRLIVACGVSSAFKPIPGIELPVFWRDALVAATAAHRLAQTLQADPEEAYLCGLLHASGHLILCQSYPEIAQAMFAGFETVRGAELAAIERDSFGIDHPEAGALWVQYLGFPQTVAAAIRQLGVNLDDKAAPIDLALRGGCALAATVARKQPVAAGLAALPASVRARCTAADGTADRAFERLYETLVATEPMA